MRKYLINFLDFSQDKIKNLNGWVDVSEFGETKTVLASISKSTILDETNNVYSIEDAIEYFYKNWPKYFVILTVEEFKAMCGLPTFQST